MLRKLLSDSIIYGLSGILNRVIGFLLLPLYTHILSPVDYGVLSLYNTTFFLLSTLLIFGMDSASFRFYYDSDAENTKWSSISNWIWFQWLLSLLLIVIAWITKGRIGTGIFQIAEGGRIFMLLSIALLLHSLPNIQEICFRILRQPWGAFGFAVGIGFINISSTYYFIAILKIGYWGFIYGQLISYGLGTLLSIYLLRRNLGITLINRRLFIQMIKYALPLVPALGITQAIPWLCSYFLSAKSSYTELGLYNIGNTFAAILTLVTSSFAQAFAPFALSIMKDEAAPEIYARIFIIYVAALSCICMSYCLFARDILMLITDPKFLGSWLVMVILAYHYFLLSTSAIGMMGISIRKKASPYAYAVSIAAVVSMALFWILIPDYGRLGAALAMLIGQLFIPALTFYFSQKAYPIPYNFSKAFLLLLSSLGVGVLTILIVPSAASKANIWPGIVIKLFVLMGYTLSVILYIKTSQGMRISRFKLADFRRR